MRYVISCFIVAIACSCGAPYKGVPLAAPLSYTEGEQALAKGEYSEAARQFRVYLADERPTYRARAFYQLARAQYHMEDYQGSRQTLSDLKREFPDFGRKQIHALQGDLDYAMGETTDAILEWESAYDQSTALEREALSPRIASAMNALSPGQAAELAPMLTVPQIYEMAIDRVAGTEASTVARADLEREPVVTDASVSLDLPDDLSETEQSALAQPAAAEAASPAPASDAAAEANAGAEPIAVAAVDEAAIATEPGFFVGPKVAALLPLTGVARESGRATLTTLRNSFDEATLVTRDTGSDPKTATELLRRLAADRDVIAVLGPVHPPVIEAVRQQAAALDLPVLPLPSRTQSSPKPTDTSTLATYAVRDLHLSRIGILAPEGAASGFADAVRALGATVVGTQAYDAQNFDINSILMAVQTWIDGGGVDAVYVADRAPRGVTVAKAARSVAPQVVLLGDTTWTNPAVLAGDGAALEGAIVLGNPTALEQSPVDTAPRAAAALQRAIALGETSRTQTRTLLQSVQQPAAQAGLVKIVSGRAVPVR
jgi:ABC-type branched-subunit amino acid transport system substrate-binding protein